ncbi:MAG: hypothetical protein BWY29_00158 [Microgenomates group bacterium ADurb.Bin238]|uniref:Uncharacterized protein n=1 Tax=Candidatus Chazhemtobacterium aquaticus TaxID=2715735 RepID=A0A857NB38_9BACT|nr:MAG: hypothetical protein BWY29_00158 [Microgenomates group bacterium ADurb.Bin238]QHO63570.1 hypothetical protein MICH65_0589 [Candidatus Chazhemtobacterium aquaticus]
MNNTKFTLYAKRILIAIIVYFIVGLILGFVGLQLRCQHPMYSCWSLSQYLTDPWLFSNTLLWPFTFIDGLDKANIIF